MACACWCCWCCGGVAEEAEALKSKCAAIPGRFLSTTSFPTSFPTSLPLESPLRTLRLSGAAVSLERRAAGNQ
ncbi:hypothetical protein M440DRAFT_1145860 [Trichoderma longibrachiatum ATCC 18648]|uniref:Uncharacterized protein n=1 Tax=Trichoderma longibrachiatum ATCC 18648 TaxID=983965 RepID=A0A2T4BQ87_TRILO|nr:hypothetical protein M440DRAFT_1145860 [Trichoderma longibrachiatum ATCC 18648]